MKLLLRRCNLIFSPLRLQARYALDAANERTYFLRDDKCSQMGIAFVPLAIEVLGGISAFFKKKNLQAVGRDRLQPLILGAGVVCCAQ